MGDRVTRYHTHFVEYVPKHLESGILYISVKYNVAAHLCACGCGEEVVTPIDKHQGWMMSYDGEHASLSPSVGNGSYHCRSHYFLKNGFVEWIPDFGEYMGEEVQTKKTWWERLKALINWRKVLNRTGCRNPLKLQRKIKHQRKVGIR